MTKSTIAGLLASVFLAGCSFAPRYARPEIPAAPTWTTDAGAGDHGPATSDPGWKDFFTDAHLQNLIRIALDHNRDLRVAALSVEQIRDYYNIERTAWIPRLDATGNASRSLTPGDLNGTGQPLLANSFKVGLNLPSYELDLFGRVASLRDEVLQQYLASEEGRRSTELAVVAAVADQYLALQSLESQYALSVQTYDAAKTSYGLRQRGFAAGAASELDLRTAESQMQAARAITAAADQQRTFARHALTVLVGGNLPEDFPPAGEFAGVTLRPDLPAGLPSDLLERRPDLLRAEHLLKAANADIGVARAAFFPSIKLTAFGGTASAQLAGLFAGGSKDWSFAPDIKVPIFAAGINKATLDVARLQKQIEIATYEKAIQDAFREVADALAARSMLDEQADAQTERVSAAQKRYDLTNLRFEHGVDSYLTVLLAQQELFAARQSLIAARLSRDTNLVSLYKALGGGLTETADSSAPGNATPAAPR